MSFTDFDADHARIYKEIVALVARHGSPEFRAWAVGSRVKGNWLPDSDWDVAVEGEVDRRACRAEAATRGIRLDIVSSRYPPARHCVLLPRRAEHA
jgi:predicted nucleotidyltransferase